MDMMVKISAVAILGAIFCVLLRQNEKATALALSVLSCVIVLVLAIRFLQPVWSVIKQVEALSGLEQGVTAPLFKVVGIGLLTQVAGSVCADAGENSLGKTVEIAGTVLALYASLPLLQSVLSLVEKLIGGAF